MLFVCFPRKECYKMLVEKGRKENQLFVKWIEQLLIIFHSGGRKNEEGESVLVMIITGTCFFSRASRYLISRFPNIPSKKTTCFVPPFLNHHSK